MLKKTGLIRKEASYFNDYTYNINNLNLNSAEKGNFSLCLRNYPWL